MANQHTFTISLETDPTGRFHALPKPDPKTIAMNVGDTVIYKPAIPTDQFEVVFDGSPFSPHPFIIRDSKPLTLLTAGKTFCKCFIIRKGDRFGWFPDEQPESGGDHDVKP